MNSTSQDNYTKRHRVSFIALGLSMILVVIVWYVDFKTRLNYLPYLEQSKKSSQQNTNKEASDLVDNNIDSISGLSKAEAEVLKNKDTDKDGLSDYDEQYAYKTSPYLPDSDGDGLTDKQEIKNNSDPNCPEGQECNNSSSTIIEDNTQTKNEAASSTPVISGSANTNITTEQQQILQQAFGNKNMTASEIREFLLKNGAKTDELKDISDEKLIQTFNNLMNKTN